MATAMNGQPAALAYLQGIDDRYTAVCLTVLTVDQEGLISDLTVFVFPELFAAWGYASILE